MYALLRAPPRDCGERCNAREHCPAGGRSVAESADSGFHLRPSRIKDFSLRAMKAIGTPTLPDAGMECRPFE
jgi:hypothetical protein